MKLELLNEEERIRIRNVIQSLLACNFLRRGVIAKSLRSIFR